MALACLQPTVGGVTFTNPYPADTWQVNGEYKPIMRSVFDCLSLLTGNDGKYLEVTQWKRPQWTAFEAATIPRERKTYFVTVWESLMGEKFGSWRDADAAMYERIAPAFADEIESIFSERLIK